MKKFRAQHLWSALVVALLPSLLAGARRPVKKDGTVHISYSFPRTNLSLHQPVVIAFAVANDTPRAVRLELGEDNKGAFAFVILAPDGTTARPAPYRSPGISTRGRISLPAGRTFSQELTLNEWYEFRSPGVYRIEARLTTPVQVEADAAVTAPVHTGTVEIGDRNAPQLQNVCRETLDRIAKSTSYAGAAEAALELSYVEDPVAVPYLKRALFAHKLVEQPAINGLARIRNSDAINVLADTLTAGLPGDASILARAALQKIQAETTDPSQRDTIEAILKNRGT